MSLEYPSSPPPPPLPVQHVMKFAEVTQEVVVDRPQMVRVDSGLAPGRRRGTYIHTHTTCKYNSYMYCCDPLLDALFIEQGNNFA